MNETELAAKLKEFCDGRGREKYPAQAANIFHQLGLIYAHRGKSREDFIYSVALLNSALVRKPSNSAQVHQDLQQVCSRLLTAAGATLQCQDLTEVSRNVRKNHVDSMRLWAKRAIQKLPPNITWESNAAELLEREAEKVAAVREMQDEISAQYCELMKSISDHCIQILGQAPCKFSHVGMGSLARKEITPYSDFENIIVLEDGVENSNNYKEMLEYFRWYSVIFLVILINLGETILRCVSIPCLIDDNGRSWFYDVQPRGICFDSFETHACKIPFGKQRTTKSNPWTTELIKPVSIMVRYMETEEDLKNGYNLADLLTKTCHVAGDDEVYQCFTSKAEETMVRTNFGLSNPRQIERIKKNIKDWELIQNMIDATVSTGSFNVKQIIYRSVTILLPLLGRFYAVRSNSCFDIVGELLEKRVISLQQANELMYAVAVACEVRLKTYIYQGGQEDFISTSRPIHKEIREDGTFAPYSHSDKEPLDVMTAVGRRSVYDFFRIASSFYLWISQESDCKETIKITVQKNSMKELPMFQKMNIMFILHLYKQLLNEWSAWRETDNKNDSVWYFIMNIAGRTKFIQHRYQEAIDIFQEVIDRALGSGDDFLFVPLDYIHQCLSDQGSCYHRLGNLTKALELFGKADNMLANCNPNFSVPGYQDEKVLMLNHNKVPAMRNNNLILKGECLMEMKRFKEATDIFFALLSEPDIKSKALSMERIHKNLKDCLVYQGRNEELMELNLVYLRQHENNATPNWSVIEESHSQLAFCYFKLGKYEKALEHYVIEDSLIQDNPKATFMCQLNIVICAFKCGRVAEGTAQLKEYIKQDTVYKAKMGCRQSLEENPMYFPLWERIILLYNLYKQSGEAKLIKGVIHAVQFLHNKAGESLSIKDTVRVSGTLSVSFLLLRNFEQAKVWTIEEICNRTSIFHEDSKQSLWLPGRLHNLGHCLFIESDYKQARHCFQCVKHLLLMQNKPTNNIYSQAQFGEAVCLILLC